MHNPIKYLSVKARVTPGHACLITDSRSLNYKDVFYIIRKISSELKTLGLSKGDLITTSFNNPAFDFLITLAAFQLGLVTCSLHGGLDAPSNIEIKLLITDIDNISKVTNKKILFVNNSWFSKISTNTTNNQIEEYQPKDHIRLILSSGTTGNNKVIPLDFETFNKRLFSGLTYWINSNPEINLQGLSTIGGIFTVMERLYMGSPVYLSSQPLKLAASKGIESLTGSPIQISNWIDKVTTLNGNFERLKQVTISGGMISETLHQRILQSLTDSVRNVYGSTEIGGISLLNIDKNEPTYGSGYLLPEIEVEIIKEEPSDNDGIIRLKSPNMVSYYFNDEESTKKYFIDNWFYPGDRGNVHSNGLLTITGRDAELINAGGVKVNPLIIDTDILNFPGIKDAACFGFENNSGITQVACAYVGTEDLNLKYLKQHLLKLHGISKAPSVFLKIKEIPRNTMGKVRRVFMSQQLTEQLKKKS
jgi:acyl-coenzyme A synthetase/AMP-(fatty) acid ligase